MNLSIRILFLVVTNCILFVYVSGQEKPNDTKISIDDRIYTISKADVELKAEYYWVQDNADYIRSFEESMEPEIGLKNINFVGDETINSIVIKAIGGSRIGELASDSGALSLLVYPDHTGRIKAIAFLKPTTQTVTVEELDLINTYMRKLLSYRISDALKPEQKIKPIMYVIRFKHLNKLLNSK